MRTGIQNLDLVDVCNQASHRRHLLRTLTGIASQQITGYLRVADAANDWMFYLEDGKLVYASNSLDPFGRLERHLRCLHNQIPSLICSVRVQIRLLFENLTRADINCCGDYAAICWLVELEYLTHAQAAVLIEALAQEVFATLLILQPADYGLLTANPLPRLPRFCALDLRTVLEAALAQQPQAPTAKATIRQLARQSDRRSLRHTAPFSGSSQLGWRQPVAVATNRQSISSVERRRLSGLRSRPGYTIACIDDNPTILGAIERFLANTDFNILRIEDPVSALMCIIRAKPDLILLDITMPNLDGYELCSLLRRNGLFKQTPIIMVSSNAAFIDRARARLAGASGYLTKPFTRPNLLDIIRQHLS